MAYVIRQRVRAGSCAAHPLHIGRRGGRFHYTEGRGHRKVTFRLSTVFSVREERAVADQTTRPTKRCLGWRSVTTEPVLGSSAATSIGCRAGIGIVGDARLAEESLRKPSFGSTDAEMFDAGRISDCVGVHDHRNLAIDVLRVRRCSCRSRRSCVPRGHNEQYRKRSWAPLIPSIAGALADLPSTSAGRSCWQRCTDGAPQRCPSRRPLGDGSVRPR